MFQFVFLKVLSSSHCILSGSHLITPMASISTQMQMTHKFTSSLLTTSLSCKSMSPSRPPPQGYLRNTTDQPKSEATMWFSPRFSHLHEWHQHPSSLVTTKPRRHLSHLCLPHPTQPISSSVDFSYLLSLQPSPYLPSSLARTTGPAFSLVSLDPFCRPHLPPSLHSSHTDLFKNADLIISLPPPFSA